MKIGIVFWSGTGNTKAMADAVAAGVRDAGGTADLLTPDSFGPAQVNDYDAFAFGCPSMGAEVLEEYEFDPMFTDVEASLKGKKIALFGSYGWGDGEWMRNWSARCDKGGMVQVSDFVICLEHPDGTAVEACKGLGRALVTN